jgi:hypothetical protein
MQNNLISDLENIVGDYTEIKDYEKLIENNPKVHTVEKLRSKITENIPINDLNIISAAYKVAKNWNGKSKELDKDYILDLLPIFINLVRFFGPDYNFMNDKKSYQIVISGGDRNYTIYNIINRSILININNINLGIIIDINKLSKEQKNRILEFYDVENWDEDSSSDFDFNVNNAIGKLMDIEPNFHPMTNLKEYKDRLLDIVMENYKGEEEN